MDIHSKNNNQVTSSMEMEAESLTAWRTLKPASYKIGSTTYIVSGKYKKEGKEYLTDKIWRLIKNSEE